MVVTVVLKKPWQMEVLQCTCTNVCALRHFHYCGHPGVNFFQQLEFHELRKTLDAEMKRLNSTGMYTNKRQAEPIC